MGENVKNLKMSNVFFMSTNARVTGLELLEEIIMLKKKINLNRLLLFDHVSSLETKRLFNHKVNQCRGLHIKKIL